MGIGPGIVTKSARDKRKYSADYTPTTFSYRRKRYWMLVKARQGYPQFTFVPKYSLRELVRDVWKLERRLPAGTTIDMFNAELCNRSEKILMKSRNPEGIVRLVDEFIEKYPRWRPENNRIRFFERRLPENCYSAER